MKKSICFLVLLIAISLPLVACSNNELIDIEVDSEDSVKEGTKDKLLLEGEITKVIISKSEGSETTVTDFTRTLSDKEELKVFRKILSSVIKEEGKVKMMSPEFDLEVIYKDRSRQTFYLWLGKDGQQSSLMETNDTVTLYSISGEKTYELIDLMK